MSKSDSDSASFSESASTDAMVSAGAFSRGASGVSSSSSDASTSASTSDSESASGDVVYTEEQRDEFHRVLMVGLETHEVIPFKSLCQVAFSYSDVENDGRDHSQELLALYWSKAPNDYSSRGSEDKCARDLVFLIRVFRQEHIFRSQEGPYSRFNDNESLFRFISSTDAVEAMDMLCTRLSNKPNFSSLLYIGIESAAVGKNIAMLDLLISKIANPDFQKIFEIIQNNNCELVNTKDRVNAGYHQYLHNEICKVLNIAYVPANFDQNVADLKALIQRDLEEYVAARPDTYKESWGDQINTMLFSLVRVPDRVSNVKALLAVFDANGGFEDSLNGETIPKIALTNACPLTDVGSGKVERDSDFGKTLNSILDDKVAIYFAARYFQGLDIGPKQDELTRASIV